MTAILEVKFSCAIAMASKLYEWVGPEELIKFDVAFKVDKSQLLNTTFWKTFTELSASSFNKNYCSINLRFRTSAQTQASRGMDNWLNEHGLNNFEYFRLINFQYRKKLVLGTDILSRFSHIRRLVIYKCGVHCKFDILHEFVRKCAERTLKELVFYEVDGLTHWFFHGIPNQLSELSVHRCPNIAVRSEFLNFLCSGGQMTNLRIVVPSLKNASDIGSDGVTETLNSDHQFTTSLMEQVLVANPNLTQFTYSDYVQKTCDTDIILERMKARNSSSSVMLIQYECTHDPCFSSDRNPWYSPF